MSILFQDYKVGTEYIYIYVENPLLYVDLYLFACYGYYD